MKNKKKIKTNISNKILIIIFLILMGIFAYLFLKQLELQNIKVNITNGNQIKVNFNKPKFNNVYCFVSYDDKKPILNSNKWVLSKNNSCTFKLNESNFSLYLKYNNKIIKVKELNNLGKIFNLKINQEKVYLAIDDVYKLELTYKSIGNINKDVTWSSSNPNIASIDNEGNIIPLSAGNTTIIAEINDESIKSEVVVTNLINKRPDSYNYNRSFLSCNMFSEEDNNLLDEILKVRVENVGYQTRAGVVEVARFITLEFPYRIAYYAENGRMGFREYKVDGEGRYYHKGLYLHRSRFSNIEYTSQGPKTWGCDMYNIVTKRHGKNGLDCSGYITWVLVNGGFDPGDVGAGVTENIFDLTDMGIKVKFTKNIISSGDVKVGDLLSSEGPSGGHIALIIAEDEDYYYVSESLWDGAHTGVTVIAYNKETIINRYYWVILMDSYYKEDGKYSSHWKEK
ncbi:MAG: Ig-like domain-containing protein [Bacilli bacterium]|nr:Ig-like domain-containing protein [Bacilli bacterium]MDD4406671.1 Ig-like domain-containing protein [Bacilli bacterium]